jgi:hypothetical protein
MSSGSDRNIARAPDSGDDAAGDPDARTSPPPPPPPRRSEDREPADIVKNIVTDTQQLFEAHVELAKQEMLEALDARMKAVAAGAVGGVIALYALGFFASAAAYGLDVCLPGWASRLIVGGALFLITIIAALIAKRKISNPPMAPDETKRMLKEDAEWARARLRR